MKLSVGIRCYNDLKFLPMILHQVEKCADEIRIIFDDRTNDGSIEYVKKKQLKDKRYKYSLTDFDFTKTKNELRDLLTGDWLLFLDSDEILDDDCVKLKTMINQAEKNGIDCLSLMGHHFIYNLAYEDDLHKPHFWVNRLFKNKKNIRFIGKNHELTVGYDKTANLGMCEIWHMGYIKNMTKIIEKYHENIDYGLQIHSLNFMKEWKNNHLLGLYPVRKVELLKIPKIIKDTYLLNDVPDMIYFDGRKDFERKHYMDCISWSTYFKPSTTLFVGCGFGQRVKIMNDLGVNSFGYEKSEYAVRNAHHINVLHKNICDPLKEKMVYDLVIAYDVLEHLTYTLLNNALDNIKNICGKHLLVNIPVIGDPHLDSDSTHIIKEDREWWLDKITSKGFILIDTPENFIFHDKIMVFKKNG